MEQKKKTLQARIAAIKAEFESEEEEALKVITLEKEKLSRFEQDYSNMAQSRGINNKKKR
jgi:hypothetical protein